MFDNELAHWRASFGFFTSDAGSIWWLLADIVCICCGLVVVGLLLVWIGLRCGVGYVAARSPLSRKLAGKETVGFFHPYCAAGGGGERVLWCAIKSVQREHPGVHCIVYTGDLGVSAGEILDQAARRFGVSLRPEIIEFVFLRRRRWVEASTWRRLTLLGQSLGSVGLALEALCEFVPDVVVDTMGYAFTFPVFKHVGGCRVGCYVHYPTISTDMLERVRSRDVAVCNDALVARSWVLSAFKLIYYRIFAVVYGCVGSFAEVVMVNSSWTRGHIDRLWGVPIARISTIYPPCDTAALAALPLSRAPVPQGGHLIVSLAQFRPEKDHRKQLLALARLYEQCPERRSGPPEQRARLVVVGGCRDAGDSARLEELRLLSSSLGLRERPKEDSGTNSWDIEFRPNIPLEAVRELLGQATIGLHTMRDEHFGISVVEFMAAGTVVLAHDSAGPAMDIVRPLDDGQLTGYLATDEASYAARLQDILAMSEEERLRICKAARCSVAERFSAAAFEEAFASRMVAPLRRQGRAEL